MIDLTDSRGEISQRFGRTTECFVVTRADDVVIARVCGGAEWIVDLFHTLLLQLDPAVDMDVESHRDGRAWQGQLLALPDVREVLGRLRLLLATFGGVEVTVSSAEAQVSLTPELVVVLYARSDRWLYVLEGLGIEERADPPHRVWFVGRSSLPPIPELSVALRVAAGRLGLVESPLPTLPSP